MASAIRDVSFQSIINNYQQVELMTEVFKFLTLHQFWSSELEKKSPSNPKEAVDVKSLSSLSSSSDSQFCSSDESNKRKLVAPIDDDDAVSIEDNSSISKRSKSESHHNKKEGVQEVAQKKDHRGTRFRIRGPDRKWMDVYAAPFTNIRDMMKQAGGDDSKMEHWAWLCIPTTIIPTKVDRPPTVVESNLVKVEVETKEEKVKMKDDGETKEEKVKRKEDCEPNEDKRVITIEDLEGLSVQELAHYLSPQPLNAWSIALQSRPDGALALIHVNIMKLDLERLYLSPPMTTTLRVPIPTGWTFGDLKVIVGATAAKLGALVDPMTEDTLKADTNAIMHGIIHLKISSQKRITSL